MSTRKPSPRNRSFRPTRDDLEGRQLLSGVVSGTDIDGDQWKLELVGPGDVTVIKQPDSTGAPTGLNAPTEIQSITIGGTDPTKSKLEGTVTKSATGDGKVFFQSMSELPARSLRFAGIGLGLVAINAPDFWLGLTTPTTSTTAGTVAPSIALPDGVQTLRFGGVDTTHNRPAATSTTQSDVARVELGLPMYGGTRIVIDKSISSTQQAPPATGSSTPTTVQHGVNFAVSGRLQLFQANEIVGDKAHPPGQFGNQDPNASGSGGTMVESTFAGTNPFFVVTPSSVIRGTVGGQIGFLRVGGNATNFTTIVQDPTGNSTDLISNFYIGGETNNVMLIAPTGANTVQFGKGMDTVEIRTHQINQLSANRGAINSNVIVDTAIGHVELGGDVVDTKVITGTVQNFTDIINTVIGQSNSIFGGGQPEAPPLPLAAQPAGGMSVHVAGDVTNSLFAASVEPAGGVYGGPNQLVLPLGHINAQVEGTVNNADLTPDSPGMAFYASQLQLNKTPVAPVGVPEAPFRRPSNSFLPGLHDLRASTPPKTHPLAQKPKAHALATRPIHPQIARATPRGPVAVTRQKS